MAIIASGYCNKCFSAIGDPLPFYKSQNLLQTFLKFIEDTFWGEKKESGFFEKSF